MVRPFVLIIYSYMLNRHSRLLEYAASYFDLATFPEGETKLALQLVAKKLAGKAAGRVDNDGRAAKRQKKNK